MAKKAMVAVRLDEELKNDAQEALEGMGLTMSLAIEMFLRQVVERGRLPFPVGSDDSDDERNAADRERRERDFWRAYILWNFQVWPHFDSPEIEKRAATDFEWDGKGAGDRARSYLVGGPGGSFADMPDDCRDAYLDVSAAQSLLSDAKELIYWALDMERTFVPSLAGRYGPDCDAWRYLHLQELRRMAEWEVYNVVQNCATQRLKSVPWAYMEPTLTRSSLREPSKRLRACRGTTRRGSRLA